MHPSSCKKNKDSNMFRNYRSIANKINCGRHKWQTKCQCSICSMTIPKKSKGPPFSLFCTRYSILTRCTGFRCTNPSLHLKLARQSLQKRQIRFCPRQSHFLFLFGIKGFHFLVFELLSLRLL